MLDYPWERQYRHWRPRLVGDLHGEVLEAGVGIAMTDRYSHLTLEHRRSKQLELANHYDNGGKGGGLDIG
jgi:hypothetical protein